MPQNQSAHMSEATQPLAPAKLSILTLAVMNIVAVVSLRGLPAEAE